MKSARVGNGNVHWQNKCHATMKSIERVESLDSLQLCVYSDVPRRRSIDRTAYKQLSRARNKQTNIIMIIIIIKILKRRRRRRGELETYSTMSFEEWQF